MPASPAPGPPAPIFIIGCGRSGTTLLRMMLDSHARLSCGEETKFLQDLERLLTSHWPLLATYGLERGWWLERIRGFYTGFQAEYLARRGKQRWAEKSPGYTLHLDFINELFPDAQYVHLIRDGRDVVASYRDRWGYRAALRAANSIWPAFVRTARAFGASLPAERYHELRYEALVADPEATMRALLGFLGEAWDPQVLRYDQVEHDTTERYEAFTARRRRDSDEDVAIYRSRVGRGRQRLDPVLRVTLWRSSRGLLSELGYGP
jgi:Sulfotransferase family